MFRSSPNARVELRANHNEVAAGVASSHVRPNARQLQRNIRRPGLFDSNDSRQDCAIRLKNAHRERVTYRWSDRDWLAAQVTGHLRAHFGDTLTDDGDVRIY